MEFLIWLLILLIVFAVLFYVIDLLPLDTNLNRIAKAIVGVILLLVLLSALFGSPILRLPAWRSP